MTGFNVHLDACEHCRTHPFDLCPVGAALLRLDADAGVTLKQHDGCIRTVTGRRVNVSAPAADTLDPFDCAHALALQCRFVGHTRDFYSVAQHSVLLSLVVPADTALWGLLHDAPEAWLGDVSRPLKRGGGMAGYKVAERRMAAAVCVRFNLPPDEPEAVEHADEAMLMTEQRDLFPCYAGVQDYGAPTYIPLRRRIVPWSPAEARTAFLWRLQGLGVQFKVPDWCSFDVKALPASYFDWLD